jgi:hypothetical protein
MLTDTLESHSKDVHFGKVLNIRLYIKSQFDIEVTTIQTDGEAAFRSSEMQIALKDEDMDVIQSSPYSQFENAGAERAGQIIFRCLGH